MTPRERRRAYRILDQVLADLHLIHSRLIPKDEEIVRALVIEAENKVAEVDKALRRVQRLAGERKRVGGAVRATAPAANPGTACGLRAIPAPKSVYPRESRRTTIGEAGAARAVQGAPGRPVAAQP